MTGPSFEHCCCDWLYSARRAKTKKEGMIRHDDLRGVDDLIAEIALTRRVRQRHLVEALSTPARPVTALVRVVVGCRRHFMHPREPAQFDAQGFLVVDTCGCLLLMNHDDGCVCEHEIECRSTASMLTGGSTTPRGT